MNAAEFSRAMQIEVPAKILVRKQRFFFDVASQTYEAIVKGPPAIPVDTGYLRASLAATAGSDSPPAMDARTSSKVKNKAWVDVLPDISRALATAVDQFVPFTLGFRANYATYVEDKVGMVKTAFARIGQFVRLATRNAQGVS